MGKMIVPLCQQTKMASKTNLEGGDPPPQTQKTIQETTVSRPNSPAILSPNRYQVLQNEQGNDDAWVCENCKTSITDPDAKMLECQQCRAHYCIRCLNKPVNEYEILSKSDSMWFCGPCKGKVEKNIVTDLKIEERCNAIIR